MVITHALWTRALVKLAIQATCVAVQLVIQPSTPEGSVSRTTVRALGFDATGCAVTTSESRGIKGSSSGTRSRRATVGGLGFDGERGTGVDIGARNCRGGEKGIQFGWSHSLGKSRLLYRLR